MSRPRFVVSSGYSAAQRSRNLKAVHDANKFAKRCYDATLTLVVAGRIAWIETIVMVYE